MNKKIIGLFFFMLSVGIAHVAAQSATAFRINEILIVNEENVADDYGQHNSWIELWNSSFASANLGGCFLELQIGNNAPARYPIPKGDVLTLIPPRQHALFWADGKPSRGTFHTNFLLDANQDCTIRLFNTDGSSIIDQIKIPAGTIKTPDHSYAREDDGSAQWVIKGGTDPQHYVTPSTNNKTLDTNPKMENFKEKDADGFGMTATAMSVVFFALILLYGSFKLIGNIAQNLSKRNAMRAAGITDHEEAKAKNIGDESGDVFAAISMALHEYQNEAHDVEDMHLTINQVKKIYSPWSSKIYTLRQLPPRK